MNTQKGWDDIHHEGASWRKQLVGDLNEIWVVPSYQYLFYAFFGDVKNWSFLEIGSGNGDLSDAVLSMNHGQIGRYVTSEHFEKGVEWLRRRGFEAVQADAQNLPFKEQEFDAVVEFDVMHHVGSPRMMALEMMRCSRQGRCLLVESNGLSVFRKLKELTPAHRAAGERSYTPAQYRSFFEGHSGYTLTGFSIRPFLFPVKLPAPLLPLLVWFNRIIEKIPFFRWQCSSVIIEVSFCREG